MTDLEQLRLRQQTLADQQQALADQIEAAERAQLNDQLRAACLQLGEDKSLPIAAIIGRALTPRELDPPDDRAVRDFAERLSVALKVWGKAPA